MAVTGKMTVDLYANPDPFIQGMKAAENSAKRSGEGIADHLDKINAKQMKNVVGGALKAVGVVGAIEVGQQIMLATIKGMADGTVKGMGDFGMVAAQAVTGVIKGIPVLGTFMEIGEEIGKWVAGVNELDAAAAKSRTQFEEIGKVLILMDASKKTGEAGAENSFLKSAQFGMTDDEIARQNVLIQMKKEDHKANQAYIEMAKKAIKENAMEEDKYGRIYQDEYKTKKGMQQLNVAIGKFEANQLKNREAINASMKEDQEDLQKKIEAQKELNDEQNAIIKFFDDEEAAQTEINKLIDKANESTMTARDVEIQRLASINGINAAMIDQGIAAWDLVEAGKAHADTVKNLNDMIAESDKDQLKAQEDFDKTKEGLEEKAANLSSTTGVSSAIGDVKVAGAADFSIEKQLSMAQESLQAANDSVELLRIIADQVKTSGATT